MVDQFEKIFGKGRDPSTVTPAEFVQKVGEEERKLPKDVRRWNVPGLERQSDGKFKDDELAKVLLDATEEVAGSFGAQHNPAVLKVIDTLRMATARSTWRTCTLNEFRKFLNLKPFTKFTEVCGPLSGSIQRGASLSDETVVFLDVQHNGNPEVATAMERIYVHPDNIELVSPSCPC